MLFIRKCLTVNLPYSQGASGNMVFGKTVLSWHLFPRKPLTLRSFKLEYSNRYHLSKQTPSIAENDFCIPLSYSIYVAIIAYCN